MRQRLTATLWLLAAGAVLMVGHALAGPVVTAQLSSPTHVDVGQPASFDASASTGDGLRFAWNFGDDSYAMGDATISHTYTAPGSYTVTVQVVDADNYEATASTTVVVLNCTSRRCEMDAGDTAGRRTR